MILLLSLGFFGLVGLLFCMLQHRTPYDWQTDDLAQMEFGKRWLEVYGK